MRRVGAHDVVGDGRRLHQAVVEIEWQQVVNCYEFRDELPMTEWLGGTIRLVVSADGMRQAWWNGHLLVDLENDI
ncbi:MAG: hypothetical protein SPG93_04350 [Prevotella sp.]|nr:hypothetical protein [Prevotella sp.]